MSDEPTWQPDDDEDEPDQYHQPTVGLTFPEKLCLAIIRANPDLKRKNNLRLERTRLRQAMIALFPDYYRKGKNDDDDRHALHWMALQWIRKYEGERAFKACDLPIGRVGDPVEFNSPTQLAREALRRFPAVEKPREEPPERRLERKFREVPPAKRKAQLSAYQKSLLEFSKLSEGERRNKKAPMPPKPGRLGFIQNVKRASAAPHVHDYDVLLSILAEFERMGVAAHRPDGPSAF